MASKFGLGNKDNYLLGYQEAQRQALAPWLRERGVVISAYLPQVKASSCTALSL